MLLAPPGWNLAFSDEAMSLLEPDAIDARIKERIEGELRFLDGEAYRGLFCLTKAHRKTLAAEARVLSKEKGTFAVMHSQGLCVAADGGNGTAIKKQKTT